MPERTCDGRCCAVFPISWDVTGASWYDPEGDPLAERLFIADMLVPLNNHEAKERWIKLGLGDLPRWMEYSPQPLYTCRHWDIETRLCQAYEQRPALCRDYPYGGTCHHDSCNYRKDIAYLVAKAREAWDALDTNPGHG
jgi:Fe-S-cluster containining protein